MTIVILPGGSGTIPANGTLEVTGPVAPSDIIAFQRFSPNQVAPGTLIIDDVTPFHGTVNGFISTGTIVIKNPGVTAITVSPPVTGPVSTTASVHTAAGVIASFTLDMYFGVPPDGGDTFTLTSNGDGTVALTVDQGACFAAGTRILTADGEVPIEDLAPGTPLRSAFGGIAPLVWHGHRHVDCDRHPDPVRVWPVRIRRDAFAPGCPARDLRLSPDHAVLVDDVLIPVRHLLNGRTILQEPVAAIDYHHVELPAHDAVLADGLAAESYLDTGNRGTFAHQAASVTFRADAARHIWEAQACAPQVNDGPILARVRARLAARAATLDPPRAAA